MDQQRSSCVLGSGIAQLFKIILIESKVMSDFMKKCDPDFFLHHRIATHRSSIIIRPGFPSSGKREDACSIQVDLFGEIGEVFDTAFSQHGSIVESTDVFGSTIQLLENGGIGRVLDKQRDFLQQHEKCLGQLIQDGFHQLVESPAFTLIHGLLGYTEGLRNP